MSYQFQIQNDQIQLNQQQQSNDFDHLNSNLIRNYPDQFHTNGFTLKNQLSLNQAQSQDSQQKLCLPFSQNSNQFMTTNDEFYSDKTMRNICDKNSYLSEQSSEVEQSHEFVSQIVDPNFQARSQQKSVFVENTPFSQNYSEQPIYENQNSQQSFECIEEFKRNVENQVFDSMSNQQTHLQGYYFENESQIAYQDNYINVQEEQDFQSQELFLKSWNYDNFLDQVQINSQQIPLDHEIQAQSEEISIPNYDINSNVTTHYCNDTSNHESQDVQSQTQNLPSNQIPKPKNKKYAQNNEKKGMYQRFCALVNDYPNNSKKYLEHFVNLIVEAHNNPKSTKNYNIQNLSIEYNESDSSAFINHLTGMLKLCKSKNHLIDDVQKNPNAISAAKSVYTKVKSSLSKRKQ